MSTELALKGQDLVEKDNMLNQMRGIGWTSQELRFFDFYLSKINARNINTRTVRMPLSKFTEIMNLGKAEKFIKVRNRAEDIKPVATRLLQKIVEVPINEGRDGYNLFQMFKESKVEKVDGEWIIEFDAHDKALPLMFDLKKYVNYKAINVLRLSGENQIRMYQILKRHEKNEKTGGTGEYKASLFEIKDLLGIAPEEYKGRFDNFKTRVLVPCQKALEECTDIKYDFEPIRKGKRDIIGIKFTIKSNEPQITIDDYETFTPTSKPAADVAAPALDELPPNMDNLQYLVDYFKNTEYNYKMATLRSFHNFKGVLTENDMCHALDGLLSYIEENKGVQGKEVKKPIPWIKAAIENIAVEAKKRLNNINSESEHSYDLDKIIEFSMNNVPKYKTAKEKAEIKAAMEAKRAAEKAKIAAEEAAREVEEARLNAEEAELIKRLEAIAAQKAAIAARDLSPFEEGEEE